MIDTPADEVDQTLDIQIQASSSTVGGIAVDATLIVTSENNPEIGDFYVIRAALFDNVNDFMNSASTTGIVGGLFISAAADAVGAVTETQFDLVVAADGRYMAEFSFPAISAVNPNRFVLPNDGDVFQAGSVGVTHEVATGSAFTFEIHDTIVTGTLNLNGAPIDAAANPDVYSGTYSGTLHPAWHCVRLPIGDFF